MGLQSKAEMAGGSTTAEMGGAALVCRRLGTVAVGSKLTASGWLGRWKGPMQRSKGEEEEESSRVAVGGVSWRWAMGDGRWDGMGWDG